MDKGDFFLGQLIEDVLHGLPAPSEFDPLVAAGNTDRKQFANVGFEHSDSGKRQRVSYFSTQWKPTFSKRENSF